MGRLWAAFDVAGSETSGAKRGFKPDEMADRRMIAAVSGSPSVLCVECGNRVRLDAARLQEGGWRSQDYYICSACKKYGTPEGRVEPGYELTNKLCADCGTQYIYTPYLKDHTDGTVRCQHCADLTPGNHLMSVVQKIADRKWWVVLPLAAEHECELCHEYAPCVERWDITPWLEKAGKRVVCRECNKIAAEV